MSGYTEQQWQDITTKLNQNPKRFGCPIRRKDSLVIGSFNALKLGKDGDSDKRWQFLKRFASRYDLLAVQEVMDDLSGIRRLKKMLGSGYELILSDTTGAIPGARGLRERLAYLYRPKKIELKELASDITYDHVHPDQTSLFNTNARKNETFDHVAFFIDKHETGLPLETQNQQAGQGGPNGYDYGVFDFSELFAHVIYGKNFIQLNKSQVKSIYSKSKADVSDHMPIWVRIPVPGS